MASPFVFGYSGNGVLRLWHSVLGAATILLAMLELWQDWGLNNEDLAEHGR